MYYPSLVHAVIGSVPSNAANCSYPSCAGPAWTLHGKPLPYTHDYDDPSPPDDPAAVIPDQRINGPVFLDCGEDDQAWTSCPYGQAIVNLLDDHHDQWPHVLYPYPEAGHGVGSLVPYEPYGPATVAAEGARLLPGGPGGRCAAVASPAQLPRQPLKLPTVQVTITKSSFPARGDAPGVLVNRGTGSRRRCRQPAAR